MTVAYLSLEAYRGAVLNGSVKTQRDKIFKWLVQHTTSKKGYTRNEIAEHTGVRLSSVCGRVSQLIQDGYIEEIGEREDSFTGVTGKVIAAKTPTKELPPMPRLL